MVDKVRVVGPDLNESFIPNMQITVHYNTRSIQFPSGMPVKQNVASMVGGVTLEYTKSKND